jgi:hypothetical protein
MLTRRVLSESEYDAVTRSKFYLDKRLYDTDEEKLLQKRVDALGELFCKEVANRGLSIPHDIYILFEFNCKKIVCANYNDGLQLVAEDIAYNLLQRSEWSDFAIELSPAYDEQMILDGEVEVVTKDEILVHAKAKQ